MANLILTVVVYGVAVGLIAVGVFVVALVLTAPPSEGHDDDNDYK